jgi:RsbRD-like negative regulator of sigma factor
VTVDELLVSQRGEVLDEAFRALSRSHHSHYDLAGEAFTRDRLGELFDLVVAALRDRELAPVGAYCEDLATQRFNAGFDFTEVQTAFNTLEEAVWRRVAADVPAADLAEAIGLISTILGFAKDALARRYVSLATERRVPTLDLSALFEGTER